MSDHGAKTEQPTEKRKRQAKTDGLVLTSRDTLAAVQLLTTAWLLQAYGSELAESLRDMLRVGLQAALTSPGDGQAKFQASAIDLIWLLGQGMCILIGASIAAHLLLSRGFFSFGQVARGLKHMNPASKVQQAFSSGASTALVGLLAVPLITAALGRYLWQRTGDLTSWLLMPLAGSLRASQAELSALLTSLLLLTVTWAAIDFYRQWQKYQGQLRMSRQEIRDEARESEGRPEVKMRLRRMQRALMRHRMMKAVPEATVVIANPTHYAIALVYDMGSPGAPKVVARGRDHLAIRIKEKARAAEVPIVENPPLAQALYKNTDIGQEIPPHLYRAVAEVLAHIHRSQFRTNTGA